MSSEPIDSETRREFQNSWKVVEQASESHSSWQLLGNER